MATRCTIKIEGVKYAKIYKHWDGYPEHMLPWLNDFNNDFNINRGPDPDYKFAQCLRFTQKKGSKFNLDASQYTGWGVIPFNDECGAEYEYTLTSEGINIKAL